MTLQEYLENNFSKEKFNVSSIGKNMPIELKKELIVKTDYLPSNSKLSQRMYEILYPGNYKKCKDGLYKPFKTFKDGYRTYCKNNCTCMREDQSIKISNYQNSLSEEERKEQLKKSKQTCMENWGTDSHMKSKNFIEKLKKDNLEKYGVEFRISTPEVQSKIKETNKKKYNVEYPFQDKSILNKSMEKSKDSHGGVFLKKAKEKYKEKTGYDSCFQDPKWQEKNKNKRLKETGSISPLGNNSVKKKMKEKELAKYGVDHHTKRHWPKKLFEIMSNIELLEKEILDCGSVEIFSKKYNIHNSTVYRKLENSTITKVKSLVEKSIEDFLKELDIPYIKNCRSVIKNLELDFYIPSKKIALEYDSFYYHSEDHPNITSKNYHEIKTNKCEELGIQLIHIFQDEWFDRQDIVKSKIKNLLGLSPRGVGARKLSIRDIDNNTASLFLEKYHLQGKTTGTSIDIGAYYNDELVAVMSFGKHTKYDYDLKRFSVNDKNYPGVASKLIKYFIKKYNPSSIISFADRRWSKGKIYDTLGFTNLGNIGIDYSYIKHNDRYHKFNFRRSKLLKLLDLEDKKQTEKELAKLYGLSRIWDSGKIKFVLDGDNIKKYKD